MPIRVLCRCKRIMVLPDKYAGQHVQCPDCRAMVRIPTTDEDHTLVRWRCECGQRLKARPHMAGREVPCPRCKARSTVPIPTAVDHFIDEKFSADSASDIALLPSPGEGAPASGTVSPDTGAASLEDLGEYDVETGPPEKELPKDFDENDSDARAPDSPTE